MSPAINDVHCHFFSRAFFRALSTQRGNSDTPEDLCSALGWDAPGEPAALADRWVQELNRHGVGRAVLIGSIPGDEDSVSAAVAQHPGRLVGASMVDPSREDAPARVAWLRARGIRMLCLFPAMHHVGLDDPRTHAVVEAAAATPGMVVFVHCGVLSVGVRRKLGLASRFDLRLGDPLAVHRLALTFPQVPFLVPHFGAGRLQEALMLADTCSNVYLDTSSSNSWMRYWPGLTLEDVFRAALSVAGPGRLVFGTDSSFFPRGWQQPVYARQAEAMRAAGIGELDAERILAGNFDTLFGPVGVP